MQAKDFEYLNRDHPLAIAHRGGAYEFPENSFTAFDGAYKMGFRYMETDVQLSKDGELVTFHDLSLTRVIGKEVLVTDLTLAELSRFEFAEGGNIPRLADLFEAFPDAYFNIDMKGDEVVEPLLTLIEFLGVQNRVCLASFYDHRVKRAQQYFAGRVCTSVGRYGVVKQMMRSRGIPFTNVKAPAIQVPTGKLGVTVVDERFVNKAREDGKHVHVWTVDDPLEMHRLLDLGINALMTDKPSVLKQVLIERGSWV